MLACLPYRAPLPALVTAHKDRAASWLCDQLGAWLAVGLEHADDLIADLAQALG